MRLETVWCCGYPHFEVRDECFDGREGAFAACLIAVEEDDDPLHIERLQDLDVVRGNSPDHPPHDGVSELACRHALSKGAL